MAGVRAGCPNKIQNCWGKKDIYKGYVNWVEGQENFVLGAKDFYRIIEDFNIIARDNLLAGQKFVLPNGMGWLHIIKSKTNPPVNGHKTAAIDWPATVKAGKHVYYVNTHSGGS